MKTMTKDVILLCKGWYDKEKYPTIFEALRTYYLNTLPYNLGDELKEKVTTNGLVFSILEPSIKVVIKNYNRASDFLIYLFYGANNNIRGFDSRNHDYYYQLFYIIVSFLSNLKLRQDGLVEINVDDYFYDGYDESGKRENKLIGNII